MHGVTHAPRSFFELVVGKLARDAQPTPLLGQHTREVLEELGYSQSEIDELYRKGVAKTD